MCETCLWDAGWIEATNRLSYRGMGSFLATRDARKLTRVVRVASTPIAGYALPVRQRMRLDRGRALRLERQQPQRNRGHQRPCAHRNRDELEAVSGAEPI